jgi:hypothetical protein
LTVLNSLKHVTSMNKVVCFDNGGESFDRYTILEKCSGDMIGASEHPFSPQGFGQHCGNVADNYMNTTYGYSWRRHCAVKKCINESVRHFLNDCSHIGKIVCFESLPEDVKKFAKQSFS